MKNIGQNIKRLRLDKHCTQQYVAERSKIFNSAYSKFENNITDLNLSRLAEIADVFQVSVVHILLKPDEIAESALGKELHQCKLLLAAKDLEIFNLQKRVIELFIELRSREY